MRDQIPRLRAARLRPRDPDQDPHLPVGLVSDVSGTKISVRPFSNETRVERVRVLQYDFPNRVMEDEPAPAIASTSDSSG